MHMGPGALAVMQVGGVGSFFLFLSLPRIHSCSLCVQNISVEFSLFPSSFLSSPLEF